MTYGNSNVGIFEGLPNQVTARTGNVRVLCAQSVRLRGYHIATGRTVCTYLFTEDHLYDRRVSSCPAKGG